MSFCPHCGQAVKSPVEPGGSCPACGGLAGAPRKTSPAGRFKVDLIIALAVIVVLALLWRFMNHPRILGPAGTPILTKIIGSFGMSVVQAVVPGGPGSGADPSSPGALTNTITTSGMASSTNSNTSTNWSSPQDNAATAVIPDDSVISNRSDETMGIPLEADVPTNSTDASTLAQRLDEVGAKGGDVQFSLSWNNVNDLDLHCIDPTGFEIFYSQKTSIRSGGVLDHDANTHDFTTTPVENIYWPVGRAPRGVYQVSVVYYMNHGGQDPTRFIVRTVVKNQTNYITNAVSFADSRKKCWICNLQYDPTNPDPAKRRRFLNPFPGQSDFQ